MRWLRFFIAMAFLVAGIEILVPLISTKNAFLLPMIRDNCGAVPLFLQNVFTVTAEPDHRLFQGFLKCGTGFIGFLVAPGALTFVMWLYKFVKGPGGAGNR